MSVKSLYSYPDIYFEPNYARLYQTTESEAIEFRFQCEYGLITNLFIKRKIPISLGDGIQYYDIITPYGYGGPIIHNTIDKERLICKYMASFQQYANHQKIVSEFVRFHPIIGNGIDFREAYHSIYDRKTVGTNLTYDDVITSEFSKHKRKDIRKILKNPDIRYEIDEHPTSLDDFIDVYYSTMDRDNADNYYYFKKDYFQEMLNAFPENIITGKVFFSNRLIAMGLYFKYGPYLHAHLSGTISEFLKYSPAYILKYALAIYGHEKGYKLIHYGGGSSNSPDNGLYKFKCEFGKNTQFDFYIAKKIWDEKKYRELCCSVQVDSETPFFPAYRSIR